MKRWIALMLTSVTVVLAIGAGQAVPMANPVAAQESDGGPNRPGQTEKETAAELALGGTTYWGVVNSGGALNRQRGGVSSARLGVGVYEVIFLDSIRRCAYTGTIGLPGSSGSSPAGEIAVVGRVTDVRGVFVQTFNSAGAPADRGFHLVVNC